jgi:hypothetical protein
MALRWQVVRPIRRPIAACADLEKQRGPAELQKKELTSRFLNCACTPKDTVRHSKTDPFYAALL